MLHASYSTSQSSDHFSMQTLHPCRRAARSSDRLFKGLTMFSLHRFLFKWKRHDWLVILALHMGHYGRTQLFNGALYFNGITGDALKEILQKVLTNVCLLNLCMPVRYGMMGPGAQCRTYQYMQLFYCWFFFFFQMKVYVMIKVQYNVTMMYQTSA